MNRSSVLSCAIITMVSLFAIDEVRAQSRRPNLLNRKNAMTARERNPIPPLVSPLPFEEAVKKARQGDGLGLYSVALHYAKGEVIDRDQPKSLIYLQMAADAGYGNAVLVNTLVMEARMHVERGVWPRFGPVLPDVGMYTGGVSLDMPYVLSESVVRSCGNMRELWGTNASDVAIIRNGFEKALKLGVSVASNELSRFEARLRVDELYRMIDAIARKEASKRDAYCKMFGQKGQNAPLAKELDSCITNSALKALLDQKKEKESRNESPRLGEMERRAEMRAKAEAAEREKVEACIAAAKRAKAEAAKRAKQEAREAEERARQREVLRQIQEQLRKDREKRANLEKK